MITSRKGFIENELFCRSGRVRNEGGGGEGGGGKGKGQGGGGRGGRGERMERRGRTRGGMRSIRWWASEDREEMGRLEPWTWLDPPTGDGILLSR